eukprot:6178696-Pleurochrysis_carterae.AAC.1
MDGCPSRSRAASNCSRTRTASHSRGNCHCAPQVAQFNSEVAGLSPDESCAYARRAWIVQQRTHLAHRWEWVIEYLVDCRLHRGSRKHESAFAEIAGESSAHRCALLAACLQAHQETDGILPRSPGAPCLLANQVPPLSDSRRRQTPAIACVRLLAPLPV